MSTDESAPSMDEPRPAEGWPDAPLTTDEARDLLDDEDVVAVWVMDHDEDTRATVLSENDPDDAVIELILETPTSFRMYSYTHGVNGTAWMDYGETEKGTDGAEMMLDTLESYHVLVGDPVR
ncbi:hypothetical protein SAMN04487950_2821 [Halogranum rubrum]|uniref:DUF7964 domain-containing protein n=1 Tax=Halogranum rubrum TaxID=553466 RepID=A0A1I4FIV8_9EURY|nr:hypothetical protein [Halogranum rubrum]SFL16391.1 hypothetical protein SAMN04487950_2821 [Halogranum rubrum]